MNLQNVTERTIKLRRRNDGELLRVSVMHHSDVVDVPIAAIRIPGRLITSCDPMKHSALKTHVDAIVSAHFRKPQANPIPPVTLFFSGNRSDGYLIADGLPSLKAAQEFGDTVPAIVYPGSDREAWLYSEYFGDGYLTYSKKKQEIKFNNKKAA